jgi:RHS repeat-associated protein
MRYPNGVRATYRYDAAGRLEELVYLAPGGSGQLASFRYRYDAGGRRVEATDPAGSHTYEYDEVNRLVGTQHPDGGEKYAYDAAGNRIQSSFDGTSNVDSANRLLSNGEAAFLYDENGRMVGRSDSRGASTYEYDAKGQMVRADLPDGRAVAYHYDPFGRRVEKYVDGVSTRYLYDGGHILAELDAQGRIAARYTFGPGVDEALLAEIGGEFASYHADGRGNIALATGAVGVPVGTAAYAAFGQLLGPPSLPGPFAFAGREFDRETELYYYRARSYEPRTGRFLQPDPLWDPTQPGSSNLYPYVGNNPVNLVDPDGQIWWLLPVLGKAVLAGTVNAAISGGYTWITQADNPNRAWNTAIDSGIGFLQGFGMGLIGADAPWLAALVGAAGNVASQALTNQPGSGFDLISVGVSASAGALGQSLSNMLPKWSSKTLTTVVGEGIGGILEVLEQEALRGARSFVDGVAEILRSLERLPEAMMQDPFMCY